MLNVTAGGDPERYMEAPVIQSGEGGSGGMGLIASILGLLGVGTPVGRIKEQETSTKIMTPEIKEETGPKQKPALPALDAAEDAFRPIEPLPADWGESYLKSLKPMKFIDPNREIM